MSVLTNLNEIKNDIIESCEKVNRDPNEINIIGVTKYVTVKRAQELINAGVTNLGENRAEELIDKHNQLDERAHFHFIGTLQSRKVKNIIDKVSTIHSLDRLSVAKQINNRSTAMMDCFIQVNVSEEDSKYGLKIDEVRSFIEELKEFDKVRVVGLMTMAPHIKDEQEIRSVFKQLAALRDSIKNENLNHAPCQYLSMGMSNDYQIAIEEGATHLRIGSNLVGNQNNS